MRHYVLIWECGFSTTDSILSLFSLSLSHQYTQFCLFSKYAQNENVFVEAYSTFCEQCSTQGLMGVTKIASTFSLSIKFPPLLHCPPTLFLSTQMFTSGRIPSVCFGGLSFSCQFHVSTRLSNFHNCTRTGIHVFILFKNYHQGIKTNLTLTMFIHLANCLA